MVWVVALLAICMGLAQFAAIHRLAQTSVVARAGPYVAAVALLVRAGCDVGADFFLAMINGSRGVSEFIYFNF